MIESIGPRGEYLVIDRIPHEWKSRPWKSLGSDALIVAKQNQLAARYWKSPEGQAEISTQKSARKEKLLARAVECEHFAEQIYNHGFDGHYWIVIATQLRKRAE